MDLAPAAHDVEADGRSGEILDRIKSVFSEKGFDGASMQDLAHAAGMSAGNFYRYFPSKSAIVEALAQRNLDEIETSFRLVTESDNPRESFQRLLREHIVGKARDNAPIMAEICTASFRRPEIAALAEQMERQVSKYITRALGRISGVAPEEAEELYAPQARFIIFLVQGLQLKPRNGPAVISRERMEELANFTLKVIESMVGELPDRRTPNGQAEES